MLSPVFLPFPELLTDRLHLRRITPDDSDEILHLRSDEVTMQYIEKKRLTSREEALEMIQKFTDAIETGTGIHWGISFRNETRMLGTIAYWRLLPEHYRAEIGYMLHPAFQNRGIMSEAMKAVIAYGFEVMQLHSIEANVNPANVASIGLLEKFGFVREAYFRENYYWEGTFLDSASYSLLKT